MNRKITASLAVLLALVIYLIVSNVKFTSGAKIKKLKTQADEILINKPSSTIRLHKKDGRWVINDKAFPADPSLVDEMDKSIREIEIVDLVSKKGFYYRYDLTPDRYTEVIAKKEGKIIRKLKFGKKSSTGRHTFVRVDDRPEVFLAEGVFEGLFDKQVEDLRNREIFRAARGDVSGFEINCGGKITAFAREAEDTKPAGADEKKNGKKDNPPASRKWICREIPAAKIDAGRIESFLSMFDPLTANSYSDIAKETLGRTACSIKIKCRDKEYALNIVRKEKDKYLAVSPESGYVFFVEEFKARKIMSASPSDFTSRD